MKYNHLVSLFHIHDSEDNCLVEFFNNFINWSGIVCLSFQCFIQIMGIQTNPQFLGCLMVWQMWVWRIDGSFFLYDHIRIDPFSGMFHWFKYSFINMITDFLVKGFLQMNRNFPCRMFCWNCIRFQLEFIWWSGKSSNSLKNMLVCFQDLLFGKQFHHHTFRLGRWKFYFFLSISSRLDGIAQGRWGFLGRQIETRFDNFHSEAWFPGKQVRWTICISYVQSLCVNVSMPFDE